LRRTLFSIHPLPPSFPFLLRRIPAVSQKRGGGRSTKSDASVFIMIVFARDFPFLSHCLLSSQKTFPSLDFEITEMKKQDIPHLFSIRFDSYLPHRPATQEKTGSACFRVDKPAENNAKHLRLPIAKLTNLSRYDERSF
jgi:hypothetical protein